MLPSSHAATAHAPLDQESLAHLSRTSLSADWKPCMQGICTNTRMSHTHTHTMQRCQLLCMRILRAWAATCMTAALAALASTRLSGCADASSSTCTQQARTHAIPCAINITSAYPPPSLYFAGMLLCLDVCAITSAPLPGLPVGCVCAAHQRRGGRPPRLHGHQTRPQTHTCVTHCARCTAWRCLCRAYCTGMNDRLLHGAIPLASRTPGLTYGCVCAMQGSRTWCYSLGGPLAPPSARSRTHPAGWRHNPRHLGLAKGLA